MDDDDDDNVDASVIICLTFNTFLFLTLPRLIFNLTSMSLEIHSSLNPDWINVADYDFQGK